MTAVTKSRVNVNLDKILEDLLKEVTKKTTNPEDKVSLTDKMRVIDRVLKWEAIKAKLNDGAWGEGFLDAKD